MKIAEYQSKGRLSIWCNTEDLRMLPKPDYVFQANKDVFLAEILLNQTNRVALRLCGISIKKEETTE